MATVYIDLLKPTLEALPCEEIDNGNDTTSYRKPNGKIFCITPDGDEEERDTPGGPWESFRRVGTTLVAERESDRGKVAYLRPCVEVK